MISLKIENGLNGNPLIPGDKSISHRSIIIPSISKGISVINNILKSEDVMHTLSAFKKMGVKIEENNDQIIIYGNGLNSLKKPNEELYLGNSGTSARLLTGLLSSQNFETKLTGDKSLSSRPMKRISDPLNKMNAQIVTTNGTLPMSIKGNKLSNANIEILVPSAQIKSGVMLAALNTKGITNIIENNITRDHTEIMLEAFKADIKVEKIKNKKIITINGTKELISQNINVPCDLSSSAFFIVAALINNNSKLLLKNININPTRNGILIALKKMGAKINYLNKRKNNNEEVCDIEVVSSNLNGCDLDSSIADLMIDEYPILSVAAAFANSPSIFRGLAELRVKESDRLELIKKNLINCGVNCEIVNNDLFINPLNKNEVKKIEIITNFDHRIAMAFAVLGSKLGSVNINDSESIKTSFPSFIKEFNKVGGKIS
ncbi:MAG: 3-phosphoshikimate 1-carboxyvinyltransferase [Pelagibacteraceae bacterium TMED237]|nr:MAG: 3-phosphoshikimate 1-carboxyvinyltransferase [Pelagibacteraceae bacterium TMED237]|tara:strand:- start:8980 stop:10278 length:1299 start_codon:yes stop_codon:yes gene_type:complete